MLSISCNFLGREDMNIKKKLALWSAAGMLGLGLTAGGATYALFTDSAQNTNNMFTAGTINLEQNRDLGDTIPGPMFYTAASDPTGSYPYDQSGVQYAPPGSEAIGGWAPGDRVVRAMDLYNTGTLQAKVTKLQASVNPAGVMSGTAYNQFIDKMNIKVMYPAQTRVLYDGPLSGLLNGWVTIVNPTTGAPHPLIANAGGGSLNITFEAYLDSSADNTIMGEDFVFDFSFYAEQMRNNP
jgi:predicted ribosomally synthesized peptide with SipW-like signal peptide